MQRSQNFQRAFGADSRGPRQAAKAAMLVAALAVAAPMSAFAGTVTAVWTGGTSNWNNASNWNLVVVPNNGNGGNDYNVSITPAAADVTLDIAATIDNLTLVTGSKLEVGNSQTLAFVGDGTTATINNAGTINFNSTGSFTDLVLSVPSVSLTGGGTINLAGATRIRSGSGTPTLTNVNNTIAGYTSSGSGTFGNNDISIVNQSLINANSSGNTLILDPANTATGLTNTGTLQASGGGTLQLTGSGGGAFTNTGGLIQALAGSDVVLVNGANVIGGTFSTTGSGIVHVGGGSSASISSAVINGTFNVDNSATLNAAGTITNNGTLSLNSTGSFTDLTVNGDSAINGGTVNLSGAARIRNGGATTPTLTLNSTVQGYTTSGAGTLGNNDINLINQSLINANSSGNTLIIDPASAAGLTNNGTLRASSGGTLQLSGSGGGAFDNTNGLIQAQTGSQVTLVNSAAITGGTLSTTGTGIIEVPGGQTVSIASFINNATLNVDNSGTLTISGTVSNTGSINLNSTSNFTDLIISGDTTISGGTLNVANASRIRSGGGTPTLTLTNTVLQGSAQGGGTIGNNDVSIVNNGLINANSSGNSFTLDPANTITGLTNNGTLEATNGGVLILTGSGGGAFTNTGATIQVLTGSELQLINSVSITGGTLASAGTGLVHVLPGVSASLTTLTNNAALNIDNSATLNLAGTFANTNGSFNINSTTNFTDLIITGDTTITGGTINTANAGRIRAGSVNPTLTLTNVTLQGSAQGGGTIGNNDISFISNGLVNANVNGTSMTIDPANTAIGFTNTGTIEASNGGVLSLTGAGSGAFNNTGGTIKALAGSQVQLVGSVVINGGTLGGAVNIPAGNTATLNGVTNQGTTTVTNDATLHLSGTIQNSGTISIASTTNFTDVLLDSDVSLTGGGTLSLSAVSRIRSGASTPRLTNVNNTIQGSAQGGGTFGNNDIAITNQGIINANVATTSLLIDPANVSNAFINDTTGIARASNGGTLLFTGSGAGAFTNNGTIEALNGSTVTFDGSATLTNNVSGTLTGGTYRAISTGSAALVSLPGGNVITNASIVVLSGATASIPVINTIAHNVAGGEFHVLGGQLFTTVGALDNAGAVEVGSGSILTVTGSYSQTAGLTTVNGQLVASGSATLTGGALKGAGSVAAPGGVFNNGGTVSPGNSPGTLTLGPSFAQNSAGTLAIEIDGITPGSLYDVLNVQGAATLDGTLTVTFGGGFVPSGGQTFDILTSTARTGTFSTVNLPTIPGESLKVTYTSTDVIIGVTAVPEPASLATMGIMAAGLISRRRRR